MNEIHVKNDDKNERTGKELITIKIFNRDTFFNC